MSEIKELLKTYQAKSEERNRLALEAADKAKQLQQASRKFLKEVVVPIVQDVKAQIDGEGYFSEYDETMSDGFYPSVTFGFVPIQRNRLRPKGPLCQITFMHSIGGKIDVTEKLNATFPTPPQRTTNPGERWDILDTDDAKIRATLKKFVENVCVLYLGSSQ